MIDRNREPTERELRIFGLLFLLFFGAIGGVAYASWHIPALAYALWTLAVVVFAVYYAVPPLRRSIVRGWTKLTFPIGWVVSNVALGIVYFGVFTGAGFLMRLFGRDRMNRKLERERESYWIERPAKPAVGRYFRQF